MDSKEEIYRALVKNKAPEELETLWRELDLFNRTDALNTQIKEEDLISILLRYLSKDLSEQQIEDWANFLECVNFETGDIGNEDIEDIIYELANPAVEGKITPKAAEKMIQQLQKNL